MIDARHSSGSNPRNQTDSTDLGHDHHLVTVSDPRCIYPAKRLANSYRVALGARDYLFQKCPLWLASALPPLLPGSAAAHVKWFASYDISAAPSPLGDVFSPSFGQLAVLSILLLWVVSRIETMGIGRTVIAGLDDLTAALQARSEALLRAGLGAFFIALWAQGAVILTPELATQDMRIGWLQAAIAMGMFWRGTLALSGGGIVLLFCLGIRDYGLFHMLDYPVFLGLAGYLILSGWRLDLFGRPPIVLLRWSAAVTLMWASIEKWAYPDWTFPLLDLHPKITMGLSHSFFMTASGMVEFGCAFALIWTPLVRRLAAVALVSTFTSAIFEFGKVDAIGHLPIIAAMLVFVAEQSGGVGGRVALMRQPIRVGAFYALCLLGFIVAYYGLHALLITG